MSLSRGLSARAMGIFCDKVAKICYSHPIMWPRSRLEFEFTRLHQSYTQPREQVYQLLSRLGPCTMPELQANRGALDRATVYRAIKLFLKFSIAIRLPSGALELASPFRQHHHHLTCANCGRRADFNDERLESAIDRIAKARRYQISLHQVELLGVCENCD